MILNHTHAAAAAAAEKYFCTADTNEILQEATCI